MGYKNLAHKDDVIASPGKSIGVGSGVGAGGGALIGFFMGGPVGAALGAHLGATTGFVASGVTHAVHSEKGVHEYVLFEWGQKLKKPSGRYDVMHSMFYKWLFKTHSFNYEYYLRLDFTINGYEIFCGPTDEYWQTWPFNDEKRNHQGHTASVYTLEKDGVAKLIKLIQGHDSKYVAATNNCKDFARKVYNAMN